MKRIWCILSFISQIYIILCSSLFQSIYESRGFGSPDYRRWSRRYKKKSSERLIKRSREKERLIKLLLTWSRKRRKIIKEISFQLKHRDQHWPTEQACDQRHLSKHPHLIFDVFLKESVFLISFFKVYFLKYFSKIINIISVLVFCAACVFVSCTSASSGGWVGLVSFKICKNRR